MSNIRVHLIIEGRVQGVWFRESARRQALSLGVNGWVRNRPDGTVEAVAEGPDSPVQAFVSWCHSGPPASRVDQVRKTPEDYRGELETFDVTY
ncbi:MAG: acylphosphatase [Desulfobacteraceae bacterium]|jgi:acylphosphatase